MSGVLTKLSARQEEARAYLEELRAQADVTVQEALIKHSRMHDEILTDLALVHLEMSSMPDRQVHLQDFLWAIDIVDHLDTLGYEIIKRWRTK